MSGKRILSVSHDILLLTTRASLLRQRGYEVVSVLGNATSHCKKGGFDLFLIGHSMADSEVDEMISIWRHKSDAPIVLILRSVDRARDGMQYQVDSLDPEQLIRTVDTALDR